MKKLIIASVVTAITLICCHGKYETVIGKWEQNSSASWTKSFEITKEGSNYFIDMYTYYKKPAKYVSLNGDTTIMEKGSSNDHKKTELYYDEQVKVYKGNFGKILLYLRVVDEDHLELSFPFETKMYSRVVPIDMYYLRFGFPDE